MSAEYNIYLEDIKPEFERIPDGVIVPGGVYTLWTGDKIKFADRTAVDQVYYELFYQKSDTKTDMPDDLLIFGKL